MDKDNIQKLQNQVVDYAVTEILNSNIEQVILDACDSLIHRIETEIREKLRGDPIIYTLIKQELDKLQPKQPASAQSIKEG